MHVRFSLMWWVKNFGWRNHETQILSLFMAWCFYHICIYGCRIQEEGLALEPINETWHADVDPERSIQWHAKATSHLDEMIRNLKHEPCGTMGVRRGVPGHGGQWRRCRGDPRAPAPARKEGVPISKARRAPEEPKLTDGSGIGGQKQAMAPAATNLWVEGVDGEGARSHLAGSDPSAAAAGDEWNRKWLVVVVDWKQDKEKPGQWSFTWHATARTARPVQFRFSSARLRSVR